MGRPYKKEDEKHSWKKFMEFLEMVSTLGTTVSTVGSTIEGLRKGKGEASLSQLDKVEDVKRKQIENVQLEETPSSQYAKEVAGQIFRGEATMDVENLPEVRDAKRIGGGLGAVRKEMGLFSGAGADAVRFLEREQVGRGEARRETPDIGRYHAQRDLMHDKRHPVLTEVRRRPEDIESTPVPYRVATEMSATEQGKKFAHGRTLEVSAQDSREAIALKAREGVNELNVINANLVADMTKSAWSKFSELTGGVGAGGVLDEAGLGAFYRVVTDETDAAVGDETAFAELIKVGELDTYRLPTKNDDGTYNMDVFTDRTPATFTEYSLSEKFLRGRTEVQLRESTPGMQELPGGITLMYGSEEFFWNQHKRGGMLAAVEGMGDEEAMQFIEQALKAAGLAGDMVGGVSIGVGGGVGGGAVARPEPVAAPMDAGLGGGLGGPAMSDFSWNAAAGFMQERGVDMANEATLGQVETILSKMAELPPGWQTSEDTFLMDWFDNLSRGIVLQQEALRRAGVVGAR